MRLHEIWLARIQLRTSYDPRPCVIVEEPRAGRVKVFPLSSSMDLFDPNKHFLLSRTSPDFPATGLPKESYILEKVADLPIADIRHKFGELSGELLEDFKRWSWF
jgi:hypothetical protein